MKHFGVWFEILTFDLQLLGRLSLIIINWCKKYSLIAYTDHQNNSTGLVFFFLIPSTALFHFLNSDMRIGPRWWSSSESEILDHGRRQWKLETLLLVTTSQPLGPQRSSDWVPSQVCEVLGLGPERRHRHLQLEKDWAQYTRMATLTKLHQSMSK